MVESQPNLSVAQQIMSQRNTNIAFKSKITLPNYLDMSELESNLKIQKNKQLTVNSSNQWDLYIYSDFREITDRSFEQNSIYSLIRDRGLNCENNQLPLCD